jgi:hypothetical protein
MRKWENEKGFSGEFWNGDMLDILKKLIVEHQATE